MISLQGDLERKIQELTERLLAGADEYKTLYRKYVVLERSLAKANRSSSTSPKVNSTTLSDETGLNEETLVSLLRHSYELQQQKSQEEDDEEKQKRKEYEEAKKVVTSQTSDSNEEIHECPMCYWEFPKHFTLENKKEHIENHFV